MKMKINNTDRELRYFETEYGCIHEIGVGNVESDMYVDGEDFYTMEEYIEAHPDDEYTETDFEQCDDGKHEIYQYFDGQNHQILCLSGPCANVEEITDDFYDENNISIYKSGAKICSLSYNNDYEGYKVFFFKMQLYILIIDRRDYQEDTWEIVPEIFDSLEESVEYLKDNFNTYMNYDAAKFDWYI